MPLKVVLYQPEIPWNTGNVGRTCAALGAELHLVEPLGFSISERRLRRAGMDYWKRLAVFRHPDWDSCLAAVGPAPFLFSADAPRALWEARFEPDSALAFGRESTGLPEALLRARPDRRLRIPMAAGARSLNLSTAAAVALYEAARQLGLPAPGNASVTAPAHTGGA